MEWEQELSCLTSKNETDEEILFGKKPFEFRIETKPMSEEKFANMIGGSELEDLVKGFY